MDKQIPARNESSNAKKRLWRKTRADEWKDRIDAMAMAYRLGEEVEMNPLERIAVMLWLQLHPRRKR